MSYLINDITNPTIQIDSVAIGLQLNDEDEAKNLSKIDLKKYEEFLDAMHILPNHFKKMSAKKYKYDFSPKTIKKIESQIIPNELVVTRESFTTLINKIYTVNNSDRLRGFEIYLKNVKTNAMISLLNISELNKQPITYNKIRNSFV